MRRFIFCLVVAGFALSGCSRQNQSDPETGFFRDFSLANIVERINAPELKSESSGFSGTSSPGIRRRKDFSLFYRIEERDGAKFDEAGFIMKLKAETEKAADEAGLRRHGGGSGGDTFDFDYSGEDHEGWMEVVGARMEGNRYKLWGVIRETPKHAKQ